MGAPTAAVLTVIALNFVTGAKQVQRKREHCYPIDDAQFRHELGTLLGPPIIGGNRVTHLQNGVEVFPAMLRALAAARHSVNFETYIYWSGDVGREFAEVLSERARAGVQVHVERHHPLHWYQLARMNNRTHRRLLIIDGEVGFTDGVGIADNWNGNATSPDHWRDSHYCLQGPAVAQMQAAFMDNWIKTTGTLLQGKAYSPALPAGGDARAQVFTSSPSGGWDSMMLMYLLAITAAVHTTDLSAAYFVPDDLTRLSVRAALERGVRVRIIVPGRHIDKKVVRKASRARWGELLAAGAEIHESSPRCSTARC